MMGTQTPCGLAKASSSAGWFRAVPALDVAGDSLHPPCVWIAIARPVVRSITGEPELPPVVSTTYRTVLPATCQYGPSWNCWV